jgi:hypothetical protein
MFWSETECDPSASSRQKCLRRTLSPLECLRNAYRCIGQAPSRRFLSEPSRSWSTTMTSGPTRRAPAVTNRHGWPARRSQHSPRFQRRSSRTAGWGRWTIALVRGPSAPGRSDHQPSGLLREPKPGGKTWSRAGSTPPRSASTSGSRRGSSRRSRSKVCMAKADPSRTM